MKKNDTYLITAWNMGHGHPRKFHCKPNWRKCVWCDFCLGHVALCIWIGHIKLKKWIAGNDQISREWTSLGERVQSHERWNEWV